MEERTAFKPIQLREIEECRQSRRDEHMCIVAGTLVEGSAAICLRLPIARKPKDMKNKNEFNLPILTRPVISCGFGICGS
jgi:hypothetical protein